MRKINKIILLILLATVVGAFIANANPVKEVTYSDFCDGWDEGYQDALDECLKVGVTPVCPVEPIRSKGYNTGYGKGWSAAQEICEELEPTLIELKH